MTDTPDTSDLHDVDDVDDEEPAGATRPGPSRDDRTSSNGIFFAIIAIIVVGTAGWYTLTLMGSEPVGVERAKDLAEEFERECFVDLQDQDRCRELIGAHHRDCLFDNLERVEEGAGDDGSAILHDREGYLECMRQKTGIADSASSDGRGDGEDEAP